MLRPWNQGVNAKVQAPGGRLLWDASYILVHR